MLVICSILDEILQFISFNGFNIFRNNFNIIPFKIEFQEYKIFKGIVSNVSLDGQVLTGWTICLTENFVPNFQKKYSKDQMSILKRYKQASNELSTKLNSELEKYL